MRKCILSFLCVLTANLLHAQINHIWITHPKNKSDSVALSWSSREKGDSTVFYGTDKNNLTEKSDKNSEPKNLHHVEIPLDKKDCTYYYYVKTGTQQTPVYSFKSYPSSAGELCVAFVGNIGYTRFDKFNPLENLKKFSDPHLIVSCGDNIPSLHLTRNNSAPVPLDDITAFLQLIEKAPAVFRSTIFMPILGNHDKEFRGRFKKRPNLPTCVYDIDSTAYCKFFALPEKEWCWTLNIPQFDLQLVALDLCHLSDVGTGHQACHMFHLGSEQFRWYEKIMANSKSKYLLTLYNSGNRNTRKIFSGIWRPNLEKGSACICGFGYFMECAKMRDNGFTYLNTSLSVGDPLFDKYNSIYSKQISGYVLATFNKNKTPMFDLRSTEKNESLLKTEIKALK